MAQLIACFYKNIYFYYSSISCSFGMLWLRGFINSFMRLFCSLRNLVCIKTSKTQGICTGDLALAFETPKSNSKAKLCYCSLKWLYCSESPGASWAGFVFAALPLPHSCPRDRVYLPPPSHPREEAWPYVLLSEDSAMAVRALIPKWSYFHIFGAVTQAYSKV